MLSIKIIILLTLIHFVADFLCQTDWMALNKSKNSTALMLHALVYSLPFMLFGVGFWFITFSTHTFIDGITSQITSWLWKRDKRHWFFVTIGFDQFLHTTLLFLAYWWLK